MGSFVLRFISRLPFGILYVISDTLYFLLSSVIGYRKQVILTNLRRAFPDKSEADLQHIARLFYHNFSDLLVETLKLRALSPEQLQQRVSFYNPESIRGRIKAGEIVLVLASHQCNWEWAPGASVLNGLPADSVYKPLSNPFFEELIRSIRSHFGVHPVAMRHLAREIISRQHEPRIIALVADQIPDQPEHGYWTEFLHQDTPFYTGPERLARSKQLPVYYVEMRRLKRGHYSLEFFLIAEPPYDLLPEGEIINRYRDRLEDTIRQAPSNWLWSHKRWKHQRNQYQKIEAKLS